MKSNVKLYTKLVAGFLLIDVLMLIIIFCAYTTAAKVLVVEDPQHYLQSYRIFIIVLVAFVVAVMGYLSISMSRGLRIGTEQLSDAAKQIAKGKVDFELQKHANDEFGELIEEYQHVIKNMRYQAKVVEQVADGNLLMDVQPSSEEDVLGNALKKLVKKNHHALSNISDAAYQVMTSSSQVASASEALAQGSTEQASAIQQITASIDDIAEKTKQNAEQANTAADLIAKVIEDVKKGNLEMQEMVSAMQEINQSSESISKIIKVIDDIAFQTNILALNAAVEAARAGDAGKGFAVVAEEVRNLAAKSAAAASETAELIEDSIHKVESGSKIADETAQALDVINRVVAESGTIITGIAESSNDQATAIAQIDQAIEQVSQVVQNNSATSEECAAASVELSNQAGRMNSLLSVYELGNSRSASSNRKMQDSYDRNEQIISLNDGFGKY